MAGHARILAFDIGGTGLKAALVDGRGRFLSDRLRIKTPHPCPPKKLAALLVKLAAPLKGYDAVTIGFPGYVKRGVVHTAPNLGSKYWKDFPLEAAMAKALGKPVRLLNDADVQGLAAMRGRGLELVVTLGTGFGTAWFRDGELLPHLEFAHVPVHHSHDFDRWIGEHARKKIGHHKWAKRVKKTFEILETVFNYDHLYIGGGNANRIDFDLPAHASLVPNDDGMAGAAFAWVRRAAKPAERRAARGKDKSSGGAFVPSSAKAGKPLRKLSGKKKSPGRRSRRSGSSRQKA
jgi:polyphosphate glucokinase